MNASNPEYMNTQKQRILPLHTRLVLAALLCLLLPLCSHSQEVEYDEVPVTVNLQRVGSTEVAALIKNGTAYLSVTELFDFLKISNHPSARFDSISGTFIQQQAAYLIDVKGNQVFYKDNHIVLDPGALISTGTNLYMRLDYFSRIFDLTGIFSFRSLSILLTSAVELPVVREMRQALMRSNTRLLRGDARADTVLQRQPGLFSAGMADWSVLTRKYIGGVYEANVQLALGARLAGGEATVLLNYSKHEAFRERQQNYQWRWVNNDRAALRQVMVGKFYSQSIASLFDPVIGIQLTNTPTSFRRSFGTYNLSNITEPGWLVELYVNDVLINYAKADASGFFQFEVPLVYGNSAVKLRFYGPMGEERTREGNIVIPFNFLPLHELNYSVNAGVVEDSLWSRFTRSTLNYGLSRRLTIGGGIEYLSSIKTNKEIPFLNTALRLAPNLMISGEWAYGVRTKGLLTYRRPSNLQVELNYTKYKKGQKAITYNFLEERSLMVSLPFRTNRLAAFTRFTFNQKVFPQIKYTNGELLLSASTSKLSANLNTFTLYNTPSDAQVYSNLSLNFRLLHRFAVTPQVQYEYSRRQISMVKMQADKQFSKNAYLTLSYEKNFYYQMDNAGVGLRYDFSFAQNYLFAGRSNHITQFIQSSRGSLLYDRKTGYAGSSYRSSVGRAGIVLLPYLDLNCNGRRDADEPRAAGLKVRAREGTLQVGSDTCIRITNLEPYITCLVTLDSNSFDNISWRLTKKTYSIYTQANEFRLVEVPVAVVGEVSGKVYVAGPAGKKGLERIRVSIFRNDTVLVKQVFTESDGYFDFLGLAPGAYTARIDQAQLDNLQLQADTPVISFRIEKGRDGGVADGLEFVVRSR